jgi:hypothetical protein
MQHFELKDPEPDPDLKLFRNSGSGSVCNEYPKDLQPFLTVTSGIV